MSTVVYTFGRINPPTRGHERLVSKVVETARSLNADHVVYLSQTHDSERNPLEWNFKRRVCESAFRGVYISKDRDIRNPYIAMEYLKEYYDNIILVAGSDQIEQYTERFTPFANSWGINFSVISAGERLNESDGVEGISGTKMRQYALDGDIDSFMENLPSTLNENIKILTYRNVQKGLKKSNK